MRVIMPSLSEDGAAAWISPLNDAMVAFGIDETLAREAAYLAEVAHETCELKFVCEIADGSAYEYRTDLGNFTAGDGKKYKGRGLLQITGRRNYEACSLALFGDTRLLDEPELLEDFKPAADAGGWFWQAHGLNLVADAGDFERITRTINGGLNGYDSRVLYLRRAKTALGMRL
jgi:putative chitinase